MKNIHLNIPRAGLSFNFLLIVISASLFVFLSDLNEGVMMEGKFIDLHCRVATLTTS